MPRAIILIDHGSRLDAANAILDSIAELVRQRGVESDRSLIIRVAHMELAEPTLAQAIDSAVAAGATEVVVHPYFLTPGRHVSTDIPMLVEAAREAHPAVSVRVTPPLGVHPLLADIVLSRVGL